MCKHFEDVHALIDIDLEIRQGEFFALLGPNGAGKTTLINIIAGLTLPNRGTASVIGFNVATQYRQARQRLGVVPQEIVFDPFFTVREALTIQSGYYGIKNNNAWIDEIIHHLNLTDKAETNMRALSGGMKRRVLVAQALVHKPPVIILDEPTAGVDVTLRQALWDFIKKLNRDGHTIVLTTHYLEEAEALCQRVAMLKQGRIVVLDEIQNLVRGATCQTVRLKLLPNKLPSALLALMRGHTDGYHLLEINDYFQIELILATLRESAIQVLEMQLIQPDLEQVFIKLMNNNKTETG